MTLIIIFLLILTAAVLALRTVGANKTAYVDIQEVYADDLDEMERIWFDISKDYQVVKEIHVYKGRFRILVKKKMTDS